MRAKVIEINRYQGTVEEPTEGRFGIPTNTHRRLLPGATTTYLTLDNGDVIRWEGEPPELGTLIPYAK